MYEHLFKPKHAFAKNMIPEWVKSYTTDTHYLNDTKNILKNMHLYNKQMADNNYCIKCEKIQEIWNETKNNPDFLSKYTYIEWDFIKHFNQSSSVLQAISLVNVVSPFLSLMVPFLLLLFPFIILKIQKMPITFEMYFDVLKSIAQHHFIGKALTSMDNISPEKVVYMLITFGMYCLQIYQNVTQCQRFYANINRVNEYLCEIREYAKYSVDSMESFMHYNKDKSSYQNFFKDVEKQCQSMKKLRDELSSIQPFCHSLSKMSEMGDLMKCFYELHANVEYGDAIQYSIGFEGYINNLLGVFENLEAKTVSFAEFDTSINCEMNKQYYPPLMNENPVKNNCTFRKNMIISSPNAGGKTTTIKTTMINIIFTQQFGCGFYDSCKLNPYTHIHSYLNIPDTSGRDSLFQAESRRCKEIIDIINQYSDAKYRHFCIFDELYSGTNPIEATKSAYAFLLYLTKYDNVNFILTTHYVAICKRLKKSKRIQNYKMDVECLPDGGLKYTYKMKKGISKIQGAVKILQQMEYPQEIIDIIINY